MVGEEGRGDCSGGYALGDVRRLRGNGRAQRALGRGGGRSALPALDCSHVTGRSLRLLRQRVPSTPTNLQRLHIPECHCTRVRRARPSALRERNTHPSMLCASRGG